jgi:hypothetical protein
MSFAEEALAPAKNLESYLREYLTDAARIYPYAQWLLMSPSKSAMPRKSATNYISRGKERENLYPPDQPALNCKTDILRLLDLTTEYRHSGASRAFSAGICQNETL